MKLDKQSNTHNASVQSLGFAITLMVTAVDKIKEKWNKKICMQHISFTSFYNINDILVLQVCLLPFFLK